MNMDKKWVQKECKKYYKQGLEEGKEENKELQDKLDRIKAEVEGYMVCGLGEKIKAILEEKE